MNNVFRTFRPPVLTPLGGSVGLLEKRVAGYSAAAFSDSVSEIGAFNHYADDDLYVEDLTSSHVNHGSDPGGSTFNLAQSASSVWDRFRGQADALTFNDFAHAALEGYHPPGSGEPDLSKHVMTASGDISVGQPVYVVSSNTVATANANPGTPIPNYLVTQAFGLCSVAGTDGGDVTILTEGSINSANWTEVIGTANLTAGALYFLDTTAGKLTTTAPSTDNCVVTRVGRALTTHIMDIEIGEVVYL